MDAEYDYISCTIRIPPRVTNVRALHGDDVTLLGGLLSL